MVQTRSPARLADAVDDEETFALLDTRPAESYESWHVPDAIHFPFSPVEELTPRLDDLHEAVGRRDRVYTICGKGISSGTLAAKLVRATDDYDVVAVEGGMRAWSRVYHRVPIDPDGVSDSSAFRDSDSVASDGRALLDGNEPAPVVVQLQRRSKGCLGYLLGDPKTGRAVVVDATADVEEFVLAAGERGLAVEGVIDTHVHADHVSGGYDLAERLDVPYYLPERAAERDVVRSYEPLTDGEELTVGEVTLTALETPGHTSEMLSLRVDDRAVLTADTLHVDSTGRTELEFGDEDAARGARMLYDSLHETLLDLPDETVVLPGHVAVAADGRFESGEPREPITTTIGRAKREIDALSLDEDAFVERLTDAGEKPSNYEEIIAINRGGRDLDDVEGDRVELEIGPNNCSA